MSTASETPASIPNRFLTAATPPAPESAERWMTELHALLRELEAMTVASEMLPPVFGESIDDRLVQARLGVAASLFAALECKNAAVGRTCVARGAELLGLGTAMGLPEDERDAHRNRRVAARRRHDRRARPDPVEAGDAQRGRSGDDGPLAAR